MTAATLRQAKNVLMRSSSLKLCLRAVKGRHSTSATREGFGSFHSEDIEVLIRQDKSQYSPPAVYDEVQSKMADNNAAMIESFEFGRKAKASLFALGKQNNSDKGIPLCDRIRCTCLSIHLHSNDKNHHNTINR